MIIFTILTPGDNPGLEAALDVHFTNEYLKIRAGQYLVAGRSTVIDVSNILGITDGTNGTGVVFSTSAYYGRASTNIWDWIKVKLGTP
jgi:hypothetical protein